MTKHKLIQELEKPQQKKNLPDFRVGDTVRIHTRIIEGQKERIQVFTGTIIARKGGGLSETFSVHRVAYGEGMERVFLLHSPRIAKIEVMKHGDVRRSKLYHLRGTFGKKAKVRALIGGRKKIVRPEETTEEVLEEMNAVDAIETKTPLESAKEENVELQEMQDERS